jgi:hypothetical protein
VVVRICAAETWGGRSCTHTHQARSTTSLKTARNGIPAILCLYNSSPILPTPAGRKYALNHIDSDFDSVGWPFEKEVSISTTKRCTELRVEVAFMLPFYFEGDLVEDERYQMTKKRMKNSHRHHLLFKNNLTYAYKHENIPCLYVLARALP